MPLGEVTYIFDNPEAWELGNTLSKALILAPRGCAPSWAQSPAHRFSLRADPLKRCF